jgi:hypothetical protein
MIFYIVGVVLVSFGIDKTMTHIRDIDTVSKTTAAFHSYGNPLSNALFRREIESEGYHILNLSLFLIVNTFGVVSVFVESFSLVLVYCIANASIFALSFTDDNSFPYGMAYKLIILALIQATLVFYFLMRWRRVSV